MSLLKKLKEKGFNKFCENGYFLKSGIEYSTPNDDSVLVSSIGERIFNTECCWFKEEIGYGRDIIYVPTISQVLKWLREEKNISIEIYSTASGWGVEICNAGNVLKGDYSGGSFIAEIEGDNNSGRFDTYEKAALAGIKYVVDNLI